MSACSLCDVKNASHKNVKYIRWACFFYDLLVIGAQIKNWRSCNEMIIDFTANTDYSADSWMTEYFLGITHPHFIEVTIKYRATKIN